jgi:uncharacterized membrane protein (DUF2068 family)
MTTRRHDTGVALIALFKLAKGLLPLVVGLGLLELMHAEIATLFSLLIEALHLNANSRLVHGLVLNVDALQPHTVLVAALISLAFAGILLVEGVGLWLELTWAAYLTVISTSLLLPYEFYEVMDERSMLWIAVLLLNLVTVLYLASRLRRRALDSETDLQSYETVALMKKAAAQPGGERIE